MKIKLEKIKGQKVLVVGDLMLDKYYLGSVKRISPEAPVPVVQVTRNFNVLGGAANVARNLLGLNCCPMVVGMIGNDENGKVVESLFKQLNIEVMLEISNHSTITKTRIIGNDQQIVRFDCEEDNVTLSKQNELSLICGIETLLPKSDVVVISDYGKGVCNDAVCKRVIELCGQYDKQVIVDPKGKNWAKYHGATLITPNIKELADVYGGEVVNEDKSIEIAAKDIISRYDLTSLLATRSEKGMSYINPTEALVIPTEAREVFDVSGAGDTVVATLAAAMGAKLRFIDGVYLANKAAGIVVAKLGTAPILYNELQSAIIKLHSDDRVIQQSKLSGLVSLLKQQNSKIVFTNGCFDILHKGHVVYLEKAKQMGDILIVGVNSDDSVRKLKGSGRPINPQDARCTMLASLEVVDYVVVFDEDTPLELVKIIAPDVLVKGGDYKIDDIVGKEFAATTATISIVDGYSTTSILQRLNG